MKKISYFCILLLALLSCKKEQPEMAALNEGCDCAHEVTADFVMEELAVPMQFEPRNTDTDSIFGNKNVRFYAKEDNAEYTWYIGAEVLNTREVYRYFDNSLVGQTIPISLVTKKKANSICFPNDDGYDSVVRYLTVAQLYLFDNYDTTLIEGSYRVKSSLMPDSIDMTIDYFETSIDKYFNFYNYDGSGSTCINKINYSMTRLNYRQLWIEPGANNCNDLNGTVLVKMGGLVEMHLTQEGNNLNTLDYFGRKL